MDANRNKVHVNKSSVSLVLVPRRQAADWARVMMQDDSLERLLPKEVRLVIKKRWQQRLCFSIFREEDAANGQTTRRVAVHGKLQRVLNKDTCNKKVCQVSQLAAVLSCPLTQMCEV